MTAETPRLLVSFGRRRGRRLRSNKQQLMDQRLSELQITLPDGMLDPQSLFSRPAPIWLEIGFGGGEHMAGQAKSNPDINFIGCEPYINGVASLLAAIDGNKLSNVRLLTDDARHLVQKLPAESVERVFILFPDPWPKARHNKRRLVNQDTLKMLHRVMAKLGRLRMATDDEDYATWMLEHVLASGLFSWTAERNADWALQPADWIKTRYEQKSLARGAQPAYLDFVKA